MDLFTAIMTGIIASLIATFLIWIFPKIRNSGSNKLNKQLRTYSKKIINYIENESEIREEWGTFLPINLGYDFISSYVNISAKHFLKNAEGMTFRVIDEVEDFIVESLKNIRSSSIVIGDFGCGKSTLVAYITYKLSYLYLKGEIDFCPIAVPLRYIRSEDIVDEVIQLLNDRFDIVFSSRGLFLKNIKQGKIALFFDGLDEYIRLKEGRHYNFALKQLDELNNVNTRLIITSRPSIFQTAEELTNYCRGHEVDSTVIANRIFSFNPYEILELQPLSDNQISVAIMKKNIDFDKCKSIIFDNKQLLKLSRHHILLDMIIQTIPSLVGAQKFKNLDNFDILELYRFYILSIINRDLWLTKLHKNDIWKIYENLAYSMFKSSIEEMGIPEINKIIHDTIKSIRGCVELKEDILLHIGSSLLFVQTTSDKYRFMHRTFMEFFVATNLINSLRNRSFEKFANKNIVYHESILHFTRNLLQPKDIPLLENLLRHDNEWVRFSAAHYLARLGSKNSIELIKKKLKNEKCFITRREFYISLAFLGLVEYFHNYIDELDKDREKNKLNNTMVVEYFGSIQLALEGCAQRLMELEYYPTREMIIRFMGENGFREHIPILRKYLHDKTENVRLSASKAINIIKSKYAKPQIVKSLIFDLDGVLVNSIDDHICSWQEAMKKYLTIECDPNIIHYTEGMKSDKILEEILKSKKVNIEGVDFDRIIKAKKNIMKNIETIKIMPGAKELIEIAKKNGASTAIVTGSSKYRAENIMASLNHDCIDVIISGEDTKAGKPSPAPYIAALDKLKCSPDEAVAIENAPAGIDSAQFAKIYCIAITSTLSSDHLSSADKIIDNLIDASFLFNN